MEMKKSLLVFAVFLAAASLMAGCSAQHHDARQAQARLNQKANANAERNALSNDPAAVAGKGAVRSRPITQYSLKGY
jgi:hypothetical protein